MAKILRKRDLCTCLHMCSAKWTCTDFDAAGVGPWRAIIFKIESCNGCAVCCPECWRCFHKANAEAPIRQHAAIQGSSGLELNFERVHGSFSDNLGAVLHPIGAIALARAGDLLRSDLIRPRDPWSCQLADGKGAVLSWWHEWSIPILQVSQYQNWGGWPCNVKQTFKLDKTPNQTMPAHTCRAWSRVWSSLHWSTAKHTGRWWVCYIWAQLSHL